MHAQLAKSRRTDSCDIKSDKPHVGKCYFQVRAENGPLWARLRCFWSPNQTHLTVAMRPAAEISYFSKNLRIARATSLYCFDFSSAVASAPSAAGILCHIAQAIATRWAKKIFKLVKRLCKRLSTKVCIKQHSFQNSAPQKTTAAKRTLLGLSWLKVKGGSMGPF